MKPQGAAVFRYTARALSYHVRSPHRPRRELRAIYFSRSGMLSPAGPCHGTVSSRCRLGIVAIAFAMNRFVAPPCRCLPCLCRAYFMPCLVCRAYAVPWSHAQTSHDQTRKGGHMADSARLRPAAGRTSWLTTHRSSSSSAPTPASGLGEGLGSGLAVRARARIRV